MPPTKKPCVLVIDDNPNYAKLFELLADSLGIEALIVNSCCEGLTLLESQCFDIIIMDWFMPEVDGVGCTGKIRAYEQAAGKRRCAIIGVSGYSLATNARCVDAGMDDFLSVPFTYEELHQKLTLWLEYASKED